MGVETWFLRKILSVKTRNLRRNRVSSVSARRELFVLGARAEHHIFFIY